MAGFQELVRVLALPVVVCAVLGGVGGVPLQSACEMSAALAGFLYVLRVLVSPTAASGGSGTSSGSGTAGAAATAAANLAAASEVAAEPAHSARPRATKKDLEGRGRSVDSQAGHLDLGAWTLDEADVRVLKSSVGEAACDVVSMRVYSASAAAPSLARLFGAFPRVASVCIEGAPLSADTVAALKSLPNLRALDLSKCRAVVHSNNRQELAITPEELYAFQLSHVNLASVIVPDIAEVVVGTVHHVFPKRSVCVIRLLVSLRKDDVVVLRRTNHEDFAALGHHWRSRPTLVDVLRTDDHVDLSKADVAEVDLVAVRVEEVGKKGDAVVWCGHGAAAMDAYRRRRSSTA